MLFNLRPQKREKSRYAGFVPRMFASFVDTLLFSILLAPIVEIILKILDATVDEQQVTSLVMSALPKEGLKNSQDLVVFYSEALRILDEAGILTSIEILYVLQIVLFAVVIIGFWIYKSSTPGKMLLRMVIVDAKTGGEPTKLQWFLRYIGYIIALLPLGIGFMWISFDKKCQGWHDKLARTVVVYKEKKKDEVAPVVIVEDTETE